MPGLPWLFAALALIYLGLGIQQARHADSWRHPAAMARLRVAGVFTLVTFLLFFGL
ncbi:MAG: hypothetical protein ABW076_03580 [Candidatus Thiodiazotropha sp.]